MEMSGASAERVIGQFAAVGSAKPEVDSDATIADADKTLFAELVRGTHARLTQVDDEQKPARFESAEFAPETAVATRKRGVHVGEGVRRVPAPRQPP